MQRLVHFRRIRAPLRIGNSKSDVNFWSYYGVSKLRNTNRTPIYDESYYVLGWREFSVVIPKWLHDELYFMLP